MKMVPIFKVGNIVKAVNFYTRVLGFSPVGGEDIAEEWVVVLEKEGAYLMLSLLEGDQKPATNANIWVQKIDSLFETFVQNGLNQQHRKESPVHLGPTDQTWGTREFYVTDEDGNTLRFVEIPG